MTGTTITARVARIAPATDRVFLADDDRRPPPISVELTIQAIGGVAVPLRAAGDMHPAPTVTITVPADAADVLRALSTFGAIVEIQIAPPRS